jgi:hypothetical protein
VVLPGFRTVGRRRAGSAASSLFYRIGHELVHHLRADDGPSGENGLGHDAPSVFSADQVQE